MIHTSITTWNVQIPAVFKDIHPWSSRKHVLARFLPDLGDIIGFQEVSSTEEDQQSYLLETLTKAGYDSYIPSNYEDEFHHRVPIFWKEDTYFVVNEDTVMLTTGTAEQQKQFPNMEARYCSHVELVHRSTGERLFIYNLHQQHVVASDALSEEEYTRTQKEGLRNLLIFIQGTTKPDDRVIVLGDFNSTEVELEGFTNTSELASEKHHHETNSYHGYVTPTPATRQHIDHVFTRDNQEVVKHETLTGVEGSDHYPVRVSIRFS